jgi:integrase
MKPLYTGFQPDRLLQLSTPTQHFMANLKLQGSTYHARLTVPKDVRIHFGDKTEMWRTTGTGDRRLAEIKGAEMVAAWKREVYAARNGVNVSEWTKAWATELRGASAAPVDDDSSTGYKLPSDRQVAEHVMIDQLEDLVQDRRLTVDQAKAAFEVAIGHRVILADYKDDYMQQYSNHSIKTKAAYQTAVGRFVSHFPDNHQVTPKALKSWVAAMSGEDKLAAKTLTRMIGQARSFWAYLVEHEIVPREPATAALSELTVPKTATKEIPIRPFAAKEVVGFLQSPVVIADEQLRLFITIAMYTGARIEEVAMLQKTDMDFDKEVIHFRGTKTKAANREVPMHPVLIPILSASLNDKTDAFVVTGLPIDKRGERGKAIGKRFGRLKTAMGYEDDKVFHSIRKTVGTLLEQAGVLEGVAADILGHRKKTITYGLYSGGSSLEQKRDALHRMQYPPLTPP